MSSKKSRRKKAKAVTKRTVAAPSETQRAESITVFWTTSVLATVLGEVGGLAARLLMIFTQPYPALVLLSGLLLMIACITGLISLGLLPVVLRWRRVPPPRAIVRFAIVAAVLPFITLAAMLLFES